MASTSSMLTPAQVDLVDARIGLHLGEGALGEHLAVVEHGDPVGERAHHVHVVLDDQQRHVARQRLQHAGHALGLLGRHAGGRLVEEQEPRPGRQRDADLELALLAVGEAARRARRAGPRGPRPPPTSRARSSGAAPALDGCRAGPSVPGAPAAAASRRFSRTASFGNRLLRWNEREMPRRATACGLRPVDRRALEPDAPPPVGASCPVITLKSVVLPAPLGPMMARRSRGATWKRHAGQRRSARRSARVSASTASSGGRVTRGARCGRAARPRSRRGRRARTG